MRALRHFVLLAVALFMGCAVDANDEHLHAATSSLLLPGVTPVPCRSKSSGGWAPPLDADDAELIWDGSPTDLLAADALTQCAADQKDPFGRISNNLVDHDSYLHFAIVGRMQSAIPSDQLPGDCDPVNGTPLCWSPEERWAWMRTKPEYNCDPVTHTPGRHVDFNVDGGVKESIPVSHYSQIESWNIAAAATNSDLRTAGINLCMAQYLRNASPGASSGQTLLLGDAEQRWLLEVIRERAQIAMLHYALLGSVFSRTDYDGPLTTPVTTPQNTVEFLGYWALRCALHDPIMPNCGASGPASRLSEMGRDFATAVQLHVMVTEELAQLLGRSSSARLNRGGGPASRADDIWGPQSWKQRLHALLFGGDPLAIEIGGPWQHPLFTSKPAIFGSDDWPDAARVPYFRTELAEPQVNELLALARRYDRVGVNVQPTTCFAVDEADSAELLFASVEAHLRKDDCAVVLPGGACETNLQNLMPAATDPLADMLLWKRHRITRDHAATLVKHLGELLTEKGSGTCSTGGYLPADHRMGPLNVVGTVATASTYPSQPIQVPDRVIAPSARFAELPIQDIAPKFTRMAQLRMPDPEELNAEGESGRQGFSGCGGTGCAPGGVSYNTEAKRLMGAMSAQAAVRRSLMGAVAFLNSNPPGGIASVARLTDYFAQREEILKLLSGSIGDGSFSLRPWLIPHPSIPNAVAVLTVTTPSGSRQMWNVQGTIAEEDEEFWPPGVLNFICSSESQFAGNLAAHPSSVVYGNNIVSMFSTSQSQELCGVAGRVTPDIPGAPPRWLGYAWSRGPGAGGAFANLAPTFFAVSNDRSKLRLLGSQFYAEGSSSNVYQGQYIATGGQLGQYLRQQLEHRDGNPMEPRYDGFGYLTNWVPPLSAELVGGQPGEESATFFIQLAKDSATEATAAVEKAVDELIQTEQDEVAQAAAAAKATAGLEEDKQSLCGPSTTCPPALNSRSLDPNWFPNAPGDPGGCPANPDTDVKKAIDCLVYQVFQGYLAMTVKIAKPVEDQILAPAAPSFEDYSGGGLQAALIKQWGVLREPDEKFKALSAARDAAKIQVDFAAAVVDSMNAQFKAQCGAAGFWKSMASGLSFGLSGSDAGAGVGIGFSPGAALAHAEKCQELMSQLGLAKKKVMVAQKDAFAAMTSAIQGTIDSQVAIQLSSAEVDTLIKQADLASARTKLEKKLALQSAMTSFGLVRRFRAYDLWRAKALVENARRYALAARRSVEARYVVNLSTLTKPEAFVASPATWSDEIYSYDLSLPSSVGLATGEAQPGGIYANRVKDYVTNLEGFVSGYAVSRPTAVAKNEIDILTLPGMSSMSTVLVDSVSGEECIEVPPGPNCVTHYVDRGTWLLHCAQNDEWRVLDPSQPASDVCGHAAGEYIDRAKLEFEMDPWGRLTGSIASEPYQQRFNGRWGPLAVNIVGTGVKDCALANDPLGCYSQAFVPYNLTHVGPAWVTDYEEIWRLLGVPTGRIEGGKAIAAEIWLDPLKDGWSTSYISAVTRSELELRPLGGAYELELAFGPEVRVDQLERIQVLIGSNYWVKQQ